MTEPGSTRGNDDPARRHFEQAIGAAAPLLDLVLSIGDRVSRTVEPVDYEYYPVRDPDSKEDPETRQQPDGKSAL